MRVYDEKTTGIDGERCSCGKKPTTWIILSFPIIAFCVLAFSGVYFIDTPSRIRMFAYVAWPIIAFSFACLCVLGKRQSNRGKTISGIEVWLFLLCLFAFALFFLLVKVIASTSTLMILDGDIFPIGLGSLVLLMIQGTPKKSIVITIVFPLVLVSFGVYTVVCDFVVPRQYAIGVVQSVYKPRSRLGTLRLYGSFFRYRIALDEANSLKVGEKVLVEYAPLTGTVFGHQDLSEKTSR